MSTFKYGQLEISVENLERKGKRYEYGIKIHAPGHPIYAFRTWSPEKADHKIVAQVIFYDLMEAYEDPRRLIKREALESMEESRAFIDAAQDLHPFFHQAHVDIHKDWGFKPSGGYADIGPGPREWFPRKG